ncbi:MAG TPA: hypothetical protein VD884_03665 [Ohtaekwangia sp.]|nr:hypothetical protein [Ohtaekwangia sp.]
MNTKSQPMTNKSNVGNLISWLFGFIAFAIGVINTFWGNDPGFGIFIVLLSFVFFPPFTAIFKEKIGLSISGIIKSLIAIFILWASLGVGELFDKIDLMLADF